MKNYHPQLNDVLRYVKDDEVVISQLAAIRQEYRADLTLPGFEAFQ